MKKMKAVTVILFFACACMFSKSASEGVRDALDICLKTVIPSLFPLMLATILLADGGGAYIIGRILSKPCEILFAMPPCAGFILTAALTGGYPSGAAAVREMYEMGELTKKQACRLAYAAFSAGPSFIIGAVATVVYADINIGLLLLFVQVISVLSISLIFRGANKKEEYKKAFRIKNKNNNDIFVTAVGKGAKMLMSVCVFVVAFGALGGILDGMGVSEFLSNVLISMGVSDTYAKALLPSLLEVSSGCIVSARAGLPMVAFTLGFGGLSVHFQVYSILGDIKPNKLVFTLVRLLQGMICAALTILCKPVLSSDSIAAASQFAAAKAMPSYTGSVCLVIMCFMLLLCSRRTFDNKI